MENICGAVSRRLPLLLHQDEGSFPSAYCKTYPKERDFMPRSFLRHNRISTILILLVTNISVMAPSMPVEPSLREEITLRLDFVFGGVRPRSLSLPHSQG